MRLGNNVLLGAQEAVSTDFTIEKFFKINFSVTSIGFLNDANWSLLVPQTFTE